MSISTHTYRDYKREYETIEDRNLWSPVYLDKELSNRILEIDDAVVSFVDDAYSDEPSANVTSLIPTMTTDVMEESFMEPFVCTFKGSENTVKELTQHNPSRVLISSSMYGEKNLMFQLPGCILCMDQQRLCLYVPSMIFRKTRSDLESQGFTSQMPRLVEKSVYCEVEIPPPLKDKSKNMYCRSKHRSTSPSHTPVYSQGFKKYSNVTLVISVFLCKPEITVSSCRNGDRHVQYEKRLVEVRVLDISV